MNDTSPTPEQLAWMRRKWVGKYFGAEDDNHHRKFYHITDLAQGRREPGIFDQALGKTGEPDKDYYFRVDMIEVDPPDKVVYHSKWMPWRFFDKLDRTHGMENLRATKRDFYMSISLAIHAIKNAKQRKGKRQQTPQV